MEQLMQPRFSWTYLLLAGLFLWGAYVLLVYLQQRLKTGVLLGKYQQPVITAVANFLLLYEPITILLLTLVFFFVNPVMHGCLLLLLAIAGFSRIRDYLAGRIILTNALVEEGKRMVTPEAKGVIARIGRIGLYLQAGDSLRFVNYSGLLTEGYSVATGQEIGGYYQLEISREEEPLDESTLRWLENRFMSAPYLERSFKPEIAWSGGSKKSINARILVREEQHLKELLEQLAEWNYSAKVARK